MEYPPLMEKMITMFDQQFGNTMDIFENAPLFLYKNTFTAIVAVLEARDSYTAHHTEQVAVMVQRFCKFLPILPQKIEEIEMVASVHDIGKVGIPDAVLKKPGKLDDDEWKLMKDHTRIGAEIILKAGRLKNVAEGVLYHHERWDGNGYPEGLKEDKIPLVSRIIAICDSTDAMLSNRVYRNALDVNTCKSEIEKNSGKMYDPNLAEIFLENWDYIVGDLYEKKPEI